MDETAKKPRPRRFNRKGKTGTGSHKPDPDDVAKGQIITNVRESNDPIQAVRDRLCLWPTGNDIIPLLMMMREEQINESWKPTAVPSFDDCSERDQRENSATLPVPVISKSAQSQQQRISKSSNKK